MLPRIVLLAVLPLLCSGCAVVTVADAAVTVVATTVKVGATVVGTAVDVTAAGAQAVVGSDDDKDKM
jgi:predicted exporter